MREIIEGILNGNYVYEDGSLDFSCTKIEHSIVQGEKVSGSFLIRGEQGNAVSGRIISTDYRMECLTPDFDGNSIQIDYLFHGEGVEEGEEVKGAFRVISNQGEYTLPFMIRCEFKWPESSLGPVKNLFHFTNLAKSSWQEALNLFYSSEFLSLLSGNDEQYIPCYKGLSIYRGQQQNLEEFLIHIGKKQKVEFRTETDRISLEILPHDGDFHPMEQEITIIRNGWGYTILNVECDGEFLYAERSLLTEDDFLGNYARLPVYIDRSLLQDGMNRGKVVIYNSFISLEVEVRVRYGMEPAWNQTELAKKRKLVALMQQYAEFRTKKIGLAGWLKETGALVEDLLALDENEPSYKLYKAQLLITQERQNEADWLLGHVADEMENTGNGNDELWAYYLYLTTLITRDEEQIGQVAAQVEQLYKKHPDSWRIAWLLLYLSEEFNNLPAARLQFLERQFQRGGKSLVLYIEALQIFNNNSAMLRKLGDFEEQVLYFGVKKDYFGNDLVERFLELLPKNKEYSPVLCRILEKLYQKKKDKRIVQEMCALLARGGITGPSASFWYERGVEEQLRITNLYELYMMSIDPEKQKDLPKAAVLYFSYQNHLDYARSALLFDYVLDNKVLYADVYDKYVLKCRDFVKEQIGKERISRRLANLYSRMLTPEMMQQFDPKVLMRLIFAVRIHADDVRMKKVLIYAEGSELEREYPLTDGETWAPVCGDGYTVLFEDAFGNRFADEISHKMERYMVPGDFADELMKYDMDCPEFDLYLVRENADAEEFEPELAVRAHRLCGWQYLEQSLKKKLTFRLIRQYYEHDQLKELDEMLERAEMLELSLSERMEMMRYLILRGDYEKAFRWIKIYGPYFPDANTLSRLLGNLLSREEKADPALQAAAMYLFRRKKATAGVLEYLGECAQGNCKELRDIWKVLREEKMDSSMLEERILVQLLYTGAFVGEKAAIFENYYRTAGSNDVTKAFVIQNCYEFFVRERLAEESIFRAVLDDFKWDIPIRKICKLAFLRYYADNPEQINRDVNAALDSFLKEMMAEKIHFGFYRNLKAQKHLWAELADKVIVEYRTRPGGHARIHYVVSQENGGEEEYLAENMRDIFGGICCREFVLFFGETLQYYITEEIDGQEQLTESGNLQSADMDEDMISGTKYGLINDLVISQNLQDYDTLDAELEKYYFREFCNETLFVMH